MLLAAFARRGDFHKAPVMAQTVLPFQPGQFAAITLPERCSWTVGGLICVEPGVLGKEQGRKHRYKCGCCGYLGSRPSRSGWRNAPTEVLPLILHDSTAIKWCKLCREETLGLIERAFGDLVLARTTRTNDQDPANVRAWQATYQRERGGQVKRQPHNFEHCGGALLTEDGEHVTRAKSCARTAAEGIAQAHAHLANMQAAENDYVFGKSFIIPGISRDLNE